MRCILHIGTEKTGTTSFQRHFSRNREALLRHGVVYPKSLGGEAHRPVSVYALAQQYTDELRRADDGVRANGISSQEDLEAFRRKIETGLAAEVAAHPNAEVWVISSEHFHSRLKNVEQIDRVRQLLAPYFDEIRVLAHLRPQVDVVISLASTLSRVGGAVRPSFFDKAQPNQLYYNYLDLITAWAEVFGADKLRCIPFIRQPDITSVVLSEIGVDAAELGPFERSNEALDVGVMALVNALQDSSLNVRIPPPVLDALPVSQKLRLDRSVAADIQRRFLATNTALVKQRDDLMPGDLAPRWARYPESGNMHVLEHESPLADAVAGLVRFYNKNVTENGE